MAVLEKPTSRLYSVRVPSKDAAIFRSMTTRMGWMPSPIRQKRTQLDRAFDEVRQGKLYEAKDAADLIRQCLG